MNFKEIYNEEVESLFGNLRKKPDRQKVDSVTQEGPLAPLVPMSINGADVFDSTDTMDILVYVPVEMLRVVKARLILSFREFFAPATAAASGGGATSGASSASSSGSGDNVHSHVMFDWVDDVPPALTKRHFSDPGTGIRDFAIEASSGADIVSDLVSVSHTHGIPHTHTTPAHTHGLTYGVFKEAMPASHSVEVRVYEWTGSAWSLLETITGLTLDVEEVDLDNSIDASGKYRISIKSAAGQPNAGRLGCDAAGFVIGAMQPV